ncbi:integrase [Ottowia sp.]|uniref:tyrosine-type recombinase/integrase n=1 Tax=Ottowia sp. TaxID=1898956 RepID=UPI00262509CE|nr:integrase [Ottowia sp.]
MTHGHIINALAVGQFGRLEKISPSGTLEARRISDGVMLYWRFTAGGKTNRVAIGRYDPKAPPRSLQPTHRGHSIQAAIRAAEAMAMQHAAHINHGGYAALRKEAKAAQKEAVVAEEEAKKHTLLALMTDYADHLMALGRSAHRDVRTIVRLHVKEAWPKVAIKPAAQVTTEEVADMMRRLLEAGKGRTANKLRSYLRAAYQVARDARSKPSIPLRFKTYRIATNPAAETAPDERSNRADKNPLSEAELRAYWRGIKDMPGLKGISLRLHLLTGGQRIEQLVNLLPADVSAESITLSDAKGRPGREARPHVVPLLKPVAADLRAMNPGGTYAISSDGGKTHLAATTLSGWAAEAAAAVGIEDFQAKRIRSGVETLLAAHGVSSEIRGRLQSHGITGVQARHYDGHDYMAEKRSALQLLLRRLSAK